MTRILKNKDNEISARLVDIAAKYWDKNIKIHEDIAAPVNWLDSPIVLDMLPKLDDECNPSQWVYWSKKKYIHHCKERGLSLGCGDGTLERHAIKFGICSHFDGIDISGKSIELARKKAHEEGYSDRINYIKSDLNSIRLNPFSYDVVYAGASIHHITNLEYVFEEVRKSLKQDGLFIINEFVGPTRFQWTEKQLDIINGILDILPEHLKRDAMGRLKTSVNRPSISDMILIDPSEAVRSKEIIPIMKNYFNIIFRLDYGGTILNQLLHTIVANFVSDEDISILKLIQYIEYVLIKEKVLESDFCILAASVK